MRSKQFLMSVLAGISTIALPMTAAAAGNHWKGASASRPAFAARAFSAPARAINSAPAAAMGPRATAISNLIAERRAAASSLMSQRQAAAGNFYAQRQAAISNAYGQRQAAINNVLSERQALWQARQNALNSAYTAPYYNTGYAGSGYGYRHRDYDDDDYQQSNVVCDRDGDDCHTVGYQGQGGYGYASPLGYGGGCGPQLNAAQASARAELQRAAWSHNKGAERSAFMQLKQINRERIACGMNGSGTFGGLLGAPAYNGYGYNSNYAGTMPYNGYGNNGYGYNPNYGGGASTLLPLLQQFIH